MDEFTTVPTDLRKLSNVVDNDVVKKTEYDELVQKVNVLDSDKPDLEKKIEDVDKKIPVTRQFIQMYNFRRLTKINSNAKMGEASKNHAANN